MTPRRLLILPLAAAALLIAGCGFHLRKEADLPASMKKVHIQIADPSSPLAKDLAKALPRSGTEIVENVEPGVAVMNISANAFSTDVLTVGGNARATEYALRYHVELEVQDAAGTSLLPKQTIELSREFTFDATQALGVAAEVDLLTQELQRDMTQTILRRLEALANAGK
ncbi:MAG TPA: LPS assembly lipoprotein LptE [Rhodanobacteraceae bacterium]|jgi:LPS-assembly lipoprotein|nr:LPS assembly lipoprotein LptE [Rhodanobacteraceae bacterium]